MQTLYRLWGYDPALNLATCDSSDRIALRCYDGKGTLAQLSQINRPAVVALREPDGAQYYATVYATRDDEVELLLSGERIAVSSAWFDARWDGRYTLLWRPPLGDSAAIRYGQAGPRVIWLDHQLSTLLGALPESQETFGQSLLDKLRRFQQEQNLSVDGIAGPRTLMMIDSALNLPGPKLQAERS
ncbi:peptidoglycan-binding protein [Photobacterium japonica]